jgi:hypothetical protein
VRPITTTGPYSGRLLSIQSGTYSHNPNRTISTSATTYKYIPYVESIEGYQPDGRHPVLISISTYTHSVGGLKMASIIKPFRIVLIADYYHTQSDCPYYSRIYFRHYSILRFAI